MPTKQKKRAGATRAATGKKQSATRKTAGGKRSAQGTHPVARGVGAGVCLLLAVFSCFGYFKMQAIFIDLFCGLLKGLLGYGFWFMPPALLWGSVILAFHKNRPVRLRLVCALLLPMLLSGMIHGIVAEQAPWNAALVKALWVSGQAVTSGGVLAGVLAQGFVSMFTVLGCTILFLVLLVLMGLTACNRTLVDVVEWIFNRPEYEDEPEEEPEPPRSRGKSKSTGGEASVTKPIPNAMIDIPVDDVPPQPSAAVVPEKKGGFFNRKARVLPPDQLLTGTTPAPLAQNSQPSPAEEPLTREEPLVAEPVPPLPAEEIMPRVTRQEAVQAAVQVARDIQDNIVTGSSRYQYPPLSLLHEVNAEIGGEARQELSANQQRLRDTIHSFGIEANIVNVTRGPSVTRYELELDQGVRLNRLTNLSDDIALALGATGVRIAPIPDQVSMVGIEVPNKLVSPVGIHEVIGSTAFTSNASKVSFAVGKDIGGNCIVGNIAKMPHLLIAGTTGSGKSVCTNSLIISLLYKATPEEVRLIMVDPKMVELGIYNGIPHLLIPVVTDPKKAAGSLQWAVSEMMKRYRLFAEVGVRDLATYNAKAAHTDGMEKLPQVVVIIDELADLMLVAAKEVEESICRVAQMGRASGMHLIIATQRPSADVITGLMKANIPSRIAFAVASAMESRIILDTQGAEKLVGRGDMLYAPLGAGKPTRVQGCLISDQEVAAVVDFVKQSGESQYDDAIMQEIEHNAAEKEKGSKGVGGSAPGELDNEYDELIDTAAEVILETGQASVSMLQRRLKLGYARAARLVDQLEERGIVGPFEGSKPRQILISKEQWQERQYRQGLAPPPASPPESASEPAVREEEATLDRAEEETL